MNLVSILITCVSYNSTKTITRCWISSLPQAKDYVQHRASSYDRSGAIRMRGP